MWKWSRIEEDEEPTLAGANVFRMLLPAVIEEFAETFGSKDTNAHTGLHLPPLKISEFAGKLGGTASWNLSARAIKLKQLGPAAYFELSMLGITEGKKGERERRLLVLSPSGAVLKEFDWKRRYRRDDFDIENDRSFCCVPCRYREMEEQNSDDEGDDEDEDDVYYNSLGSVSVTEATENGWLFDGALHVCVDLRFELFKVLPAPPKAAGAISNNILNTLKNNVDDPPYSDFQLISSDGQRIKTYKLLLASASPVFRAMFDTDCKETREGCCEIEDADGEAIKALLACVLGVESVKFEEMDFQLLKKLSILADKYEILPLKNDCEERLASRISLDNVFDFLSYALQYNSEPLKTAGFIFLEDAFDNTRLNEVMEKLKQVGEALCEEYLDHLHLRRNGETRKRALEGEVEGNDRKRKIMVRERY